jgi:amphi-Trp domain-containing protein
MAVPNVEFKRKARLSRQEVADRLVSLGNALAEGSEIELKSGGDTLKIGVASRLDWGLEIEIDGEETELEIELKWTDDPPSNSEPAAPPAADDPASAATNPANDPAAPPDRPARAHRGRSRKAAAT